jgi:hypothetical protein
VFDSQFLLQACYFGFRMGDLPIPCRYMPEASSIDFRRSVVYGVGTLKALLQYGLRKYRFAEFTLFDSPTRVKT